MDRLPFDPAKMAARKAVEQRSRPVPAGAPLTVSQLSTRLEAAIRDAMPTSVQVVGEISGFRDRTHWYFDLKDDAAVICCVMFQSAARRAATTPENGVQVVVKGRLEYYAKQGRVTLLVDSIEPVGAGAMDLALKRLVEEVRALGWLDPGRKRPLPRFPSRVAVITSRTGAALQDVLVTMRRRCPAVGVLLVDVRVQGDGAECEIAAAVREISARASELAVDAVLVTRGGGSKEDMWCFNDRDVAEAIVTCSIPVVAAIGHETDTTLAELVADERCATPTQAAMRLTPDVAELLRQVDSTRGRLDTAVRRWIIAEQRHLETLGQRPMFRQPVSVVRRCEELLRDAADTLHAAVKRAASDRRGVLRLASATIDRLAPRAVHKAARLRVDSLDQRLTAAARALLDSDELDALAEDLADAVPRLSASASQRLASAAARLESLSPQRVLERGYSVTLTTQGRAVRSASEVSPGEHLTTRVASGSIDSVVAGPQTPPPAPAKPVPANPVPAKPARPAPPKGPEHDGGLFGP